MGLFKYMWNSKSSLQWCSSIIPPTWTESLLVLLNYFGQVERMKVVAMWISFPTNQESTHSDFSIKSYGQNTKTCSHGVFPPRFMLTCHLLLNFLHERDRFWQSCLHKSCIPVSYLSNGMWLVFFWFFYWELWPKYESMSGWAHAETGCCVGQFWAIYHWIWILGSSWTL